MIFTYEYEYILKINNVIYKMPYSLITGPLRARHHSRYCWLDLLIISCHWHLSFLRPENIRKPLVFLCFQGI